MMKINKNYFKLLFSMFFVLSVHLGFMGEFEVKAQIKTKNKKDAKRDVSEVIGVIRITDSADIYANCIKRKNSYYNLFGPIIGKITANEKVTLLDLRSDRDYRSPYFIKIKTQKGIIGWAQAYFRKIKFYGERGAITRIDLSKPYEFECSVKEVNKMIKKYNTFILNYPNSVYKWYALKKMAWLYEYTLQCPISVTEKQHVIDKIKFIYKTFIKKFTNTENQQLALKVFEKNMNKERKNIVSKTGIDVYEPLNNVLGGFLAGLVDEICVYPYGKEK